MAKRPINVVIIDGRMVTDPKPGEIPTAKGPLPKADFSIAQNFFRGGKEVTQYLDVTAFGQTADFVNQYLHRGRLVLVKGEYRVTKDESTNKRYHVIAANTVDPLDAPASGNS